MILVTAFIVLVTFISQHIGSAWSGLTSTFPVILAVMGSVAHFIGKQASTLFTIIFSHYINRKPFAKPATVLNT